MTRDLALTDSPETLAFEAVVAVLRSDDDLRRIALSTRAWDGGPEDLAPPTIAKLPWMRVTPTAGQSNWESEGQHRVEMHVQFELAIEGTKAANLLNLWGAVRNALFPADPDRRELVDTVFLSAGIVQGTIEIEPLKIKTLDGNLHALTSNGSLRLTLLIST